MRCFLICCLAVLMAPLAWGEEKKVKNEEYLDFNYGQDTGGDEWVQAIHVQSPAYRSDVKGDTKIEFTAKGMRFAKAMCWRQPTAENPSHWGHDAIVMPEVELGSDGKGSFVFRADDFPHGPTNLRIFARNDAGKRDICELQLYNTGGVKWNQGIPKTDPPAAKGMKLVFADDFDGPLSVSKDGRGTRWNAHKPTFGDFSGWPFSDPDHPNRPLRQRDTYLHIAARKADEKDKGSTGLIAPVDMDGKGFWAKPPCYLECRFTAQSAPGTWPAFWTITNIYRNKPGDELDIVEAYGGVGKTLKGEPTPNHPGYSIVTHFWNQTNPDGSKKKSYSKRVDTMTLGGKSYFSTTFHTYAVYIGLEETVYYYDDIEVLRHPTGELSKQPHCFLVNYAIGGISGWKIDLERYGNGSDMYVDYVRVYEGQ